MNPEQLEKIRKRKYAEDRVVYTVFDNDEEATALHIVYDNELFVAYMMLKRVYETKEEAEWHHKTYAECTERFEPPMWEVIWKDMDAYYKFCFVLDEQYYCFTVDTFGIDIAIEGIDTIFHKPPTKENYEKACKEVRDLFERKKNNG